jgi:hypothetical protein
VRIACFIFIAIAVVATTTVATPGETAKTVRSDPTGIPGTSSVRSDNCGGVTRSADVDGASSARRSPGDWIEDLGVLVLRMGPPDTEEDFDYVGDLMETILPVMVEVLGSPVTLDTLIVTFSNELQHYKCYANTIVMDPISPDPDTGTDTGWDNLFIHELTHAFQDDLLCDSSAPSWLTEGMAEAARYFVPEMVSETSVRNVRRRPFDKRMAVYDMYDNAGEQVLGGCCTIAWRIDFDMLYQSAAGTLIVPAMAQIAAGLSSPHPLAKLTAELRAEVAKSPALMYEAIDRAWSAPVDGVAPPSRWMRKRSVTCPSVRNGEFIALIPAYSFNNINPPKLGILRFTRTGGQYEYVTPTAGLRYTGVDASTFVPANNYFWPRVPDLKEGAYRVDIETTSQTGEAMQARTWIIVAGAPYVRDTLWEGVAVVFVDGDGRPVDIPHNSLTVNGRITARVPGAVMALPYEGNLGSLTFKWNGRVIGTVTATGEMPRMVVMSVDGQAPPAVVSWTPYHPTLGDTVTVVLRRDRSSLDPTSASPQAVDVILYDVDGNVAGGAEMAAAPEDENILLADLIVSPDLSYGVLAFGVGTSIHQGACRGSPSCRPLWGYEFETKRAPHLDQIRVLFDGTFLFVEFERVVDPADVSLSTSSSPGGPWTVQSDTPVTPVENTVRWDVRGLVGTGTYVRVAETSGRVLFTEYVMSAPKVVRLVPQHPFPNPGVGVVRWPFQVAAPTSATFEVFDVLGRRVFSQASTPLFTGIEVFQWDSSAVDRRSPAGVYFLRVKGAGETFSRKIVIVR